jgi:hypothetical protein
MSILLPGTPAVGIPTTKVNPNVPQASTSVNAIHYTPPSVWGIDEAVEEGAALSFRRVELRQLIVDHDYQRPLDERWVGRILVVFDPAKIGVLIVNERKEREQYAVIDGQYRRAVLLHKYGVRFRVPCIVYHNLTVQQEAVLFYSFNAEHRPVHQTELFKAQIAAGDPEAATMLRLAEEAGFEFAPSANVDPDRAGVIRAIGAVRSILRTFGEELAGDALKLVNAVEGWQDDPANSQRPLLRGVAIFLYTYRGRFDRKRLVARLARRQPRDVIEIARSRNSDRNGQTSRLIAGVIRDLYNENLPLKQQL